MNDSHKALWLTVFVAIALLALVAFWIIALFFWPSAPTKEEMIDRLASQTAPAISSDQKSSLLDRLNGAQNNSSISATEKAAILEKLSSQ